MTATGDMITLITEGTIVQQGDPKTSRVSREFDTIMVYEFGVIARRGTDGSGNVEQRTILR